MDVIAAVDLGSNSFRLQVGRVANGQVYAADTLKEPVRLAAGLSADKWLDGDSFQRGLAALRLFNARLVEFAPEAVRAVATNTLRVARNAGDFLRQAEAVLGFPIEVIAGREEARLIYLGVAHTFSDHSRQQLVVDIGGGSTEFIIGKGLEPVLLDSLYMGCVGYSLRHFPEGKADKRCFQAAELAARRELQAIVHDYRDAGWERAIGSSGTAKALEEVLVLNGLSEEGITLSGLEKLRAIFQRAGHVEATSLDGLREDRIPVILGGLSIMSAVFHEFGLQHMAFSEGALRLGVLYDLLGRTHQHDQRDTTVETFMGRYHVNAQQAKQVADTACALLAQINPDAAETAHMERRFLRWAALLHEIGISVAYAGYHKHGAYILANADMPGFSKKEQARLARLVLAHRGKSMRLADFDLSDPDWPLAVCLRLAALIHRARDGQGIPDISLIRAKRGFSMLIPPDWLQERPLTSAALKEEQGQWESVQRTLSIKNRKPDAE
ncbi:MAG: exopolyphosphatase [Azoarcus sp.]|jgi:exopolyphosphatase/guanosine-5'-triphosphate,3'-diphosphate pyrophosphatase|nr:exopolyphosphatase [Azoarcus sp.]